MRLFVFAAFVAATLFSKNLESHLLTEATDIAKYFKPFAGQPKPCNLKNVDCMYVINLDKRQEKWERTAMLLEPFGLVYNRFPAINGWELPADAIAALKGEKCKLTNGKIGCILTHLSILQDALDRNFNTIWILQDDLRVRSKLSHVGGYIDKLNEIDPAWDLLFTDLDMVRNTENSTVLKAACITGAFRENQEVNDESWYLKRKKVGKDFERIRLRYGFHSVLVSKRGMKKILHYFKHVNLHTSFDIDIHFIKGIREYGLRKPIIENDPNWLISDSLNLVNIEKLPSPYNKVTEILPINQHGWFSKENAFILETLIKNNNIQTVIELGSWLGKSTVFIAKQLPENGKVYAVDHWLGSPEHQLPGRDDVKRLLPNLYEQFLSNIIQRKLTDKVIPWKMTTSEAAKKMLQENVSIDMVYVDAEHSEEAVFNDLENWYPLIKKGGVLCGDDWSWGGDFPVRTAVTRFAEKHKLKYKAYSSFWYIKV